MVDVESNERVISLDEIQLKENISKKEEDL